MGEGRQFQLRVEAFNVLNHANLDPPHVNVDAVKSGAIAQSEEGRLKFVF